MQKNTVLLISMGILALVILLVAFKNIKGNQTVKVPPSNGGDKGFAVVELFTSEGCSSCPPADELIAILQKQNTQRPIYVLAYHVDYWDNKEWRDTFDNHEYSKRQSDYSGWLRLQSIYTPQIVVNGRTEFVGSDKDALLKAVTTGLSTSPADSLSITCRLVNDQIVVEYQTDARMGRTSLVFTLIQKSGQSKVRGGENAGLTLTHVQIVRKLLVTTLHANNDSVQLTVPSDFKTNEWELIAFLQNKADGSILTAARSTVAKPYGNTAGR
jgi:hypothetical protein